MSYRVEYQKFDSRTGFGWSGKNFKTFKDAYNFFKSVGKADLLEFRKFDGYYFVSRK